MVTIKKHKIQESLYFAFSGIISAVGTERNVKIEIGFAFLATLMGIFLGITQVEWMALVIMIFAVISAEIFNSAIEAICNCERDTFHLGYGDTRAARDIAAGAVLFLSLGSVVLGLIIFVPYWLRFLEFNLTR